LRSVAIGLFSFHSGAALATLVGLPIELLVVKIVNAS
jgi:ACR3 family arsenite efflux pump ArsB